MNMQRYTSIYTIEGEKGIDGDAWMLGMSLEAGACNPASWCSFWMELVLQRGASEQGLNLWIAQHSKATCQAVEESPFTRLAQTLFHELPFLFSC